VTGSRFLARAPCVRHRRNRDRGSWLVRELLARNANVAVLVRDADPQSELLRSGDIQRCTVFNGTVEDLWTLERAISLHEAEYVFHLAAQTIVGVAHRNPFTTFETNVRGTYNLLEASRIHASLVRGVIVASSDKAYGEVDALPYVETMPLRGRHPYEVSKSCTDLIAASYCHSYGVPVTIARCGNIYGGGDLNWSRIVPGTIRSLLRGERPTLRSDGTFRRDYIYVKDVARAYMLLGEHSCDPAVRGEAFNFSDESPLSVLDIVNAIRRLLGSDLEPRRAECRAGRDPGSVPVRGEGPGHTELARDVRPGYRAARDHRVVSGAPGVTCGR
jgi:CDP-glucose 4,6-dehydratase